MFDPSSVKESDRIWFEGEALFLQSNMGSLGFATTSESTTSIVDGQVKQPHFDWEWGMRLGMGYKIPHDKWGLFLNYTYLQGDASGHAGGRWGGGFPYLG